MPTSMTPKDFIDRFALDTIEATRLVYEKKLFGHLMILIYSAIDAMGLLDAPPEQTAANGKSFQAWVKKYLLNNPEIQFNEIDLWAARCSVLHTFTSKSDLSNAHMKRGQVLHEHIATVHRPKMTKPSDDNMLRCRTKLDFQRLIKTFPGNARIARKLRHTLGELQRRRGQVLHERSATVHRQKWQKPLVTEAAQ